MDCFVACAPHNDDVPGLDRLLASPIWSRGAGRRASFAHGNAKVYPLASGHHWKCEQCAEKDIFTSMSLSYNNRFNDDIFGTAIEGA
jgi:hypothetical protein